MCIQIYKYIFNNRNNKDERDTNIDMHTGMIIYI